MKRHARILAFGQRLGKTEVVGIAAAKAAMSQSDENTVAASKPYAKP